MKKVFLVFSFLLLVTFFVIAQANNLQKIEIKKVFGGNQYYYMDVRLSMKQLEEQLIKIPETVPEIKKAKRFYIPGIIFAGAGGYMIGYELGTAASGRDPKWENAAYGVAGAAIGIYFAKQYDKHFEKAVEIYNSIIEAPKTDQ